MKPTRQLQYAGRDGLIALHAEKPGSAPPAVAEVRKPARLITCRPHPFEHIVLVAAEIDGRVELLRISRSDDHALSVLSASDRARVAAMVSAMHCAAHHQDGGRPDAA